MDEQSAKFEVDREFLFVGRTFEEYCRMFGLDPAALAGQAVLDCPGGPSSFAAVASAIGGDVTAVDAAYGPPVDELAERCRADVEANLAQLREKRDLFVWDYYGDVATRGRYLRAAAERFLADYGHRPERYVAAALPDLPFETGAFDLALSANLCFLYDDRLDAAFHRAALLELSRVAREVRVFPLASLDRTRSALVDDAVDALRDAGREVRFRAVPYEFQPGATEALVIERGGH